VVQAIRMQYGSHTFPLASCDAGVMEPQVVFVDELDVLSWRHLWPMEQMKTVSVLVMNDAWIKGDEMKLKKMVMSVCTVTSGATRTPRHSC
jgi:hypothetical protein